MASHVPPEPQHWNTDLANRFAYEALREQRTARRWSTFFKMLIFLYLLALLAISLPHLGRLGGFFGADKITALVDINGVIAEGADASADSIVAGLRAAFESPRTVGVIMRINSPGGSPVQAGYVNDEIYRLKDKYPDIKLYAVIQDICASGGYYIAAAADEIYADKASLVGSIGVRFDSFGFVDAIDKLGIERRLFTAGEHKAFLDPFLPLDETETGHIGNVLDEIHQQFVETVRKGRGSRVMQSDELFSGLIWTGEKGMALGLVDALGSSGFVAREIIGAEDIVDFTPRRSPLERFTRGLGAALAKELAVRAPGFQLR